MLKKTCLFFLILIMGFLVYVPQGFGQKTSRSPLMAEQEVRTYNRNNKAENSISFHKFYRDSMERTRWEQGSFVTIYDPIARTTTILDTNNKTFHRMDWPKLPLPITTQLNTNTISSSIEEVNLGTQQIEGLATDGKETISFIPAGSSLGNEVAIETTSQVWESKEIALPLRYMIKDSSGNSMVMLFKNIKLGVEPDASLFEIPSGYTGLAFNSASSKIRPSADCPINVTPAANPIGYLYIPNISGAFGGAIAEASCGNIGSIGYGIYNYSVVNLYATYYTPSYSYVYFQSTGNGTGSNVAVANFTKSNNGATKTVYVTIY